MNVEQLLESVTGLLGFRVVERENDAVLVRGEGTNSVTVRPATNAEVAMFTSILGLVRRLNDAMDQDALNTRQNQALLTRIEELRVANKGLAEEREFLAEVHRERINSMQIKFDAGLIACAERMQEKWLKKFEVLETHIRDLEEASGKMHRLSSAAHDKLEHAQERAESAEEMASQMHSKLSDAEEKITELKAEVASLQDELKTYETEEKS